MQHENNELNMSAEGIYGQRKNEIAKKRDRMKFRTFDHSVEVVESTGNNDLEMNNLSQNVDEIVVVLKPTNHPLPQFYHQNHKNFEKASSSDDDSITSDLYNFQTRSNKIKMQSSANGDTIGSNNASSTLRRKRGKPPIQQNTSSTVHNIVKMKDSQGTTNRTSKSKKDGQHQRQGM